MKKIIVNLPTENEIENMDFKNIKICLNYYYKIDITKENFENVQDFVNFFKKRIQIINTLTEIIRKVWIKTNSYVNSGSYTKTKQQELNEKIEEVYKPLFNKIGEVLKSDYKIMRILKELENLINTKNVNNNDKYNLQIEKKKNIIIKNESKTIKNIKKTIDFIDSINNTNFQKNVA